MASWTPQYSTLLSQVLDAEVDTQEQIETRQDYCKILDCVTSTYMRSNNYYTGSKAEGLNLPGSDDDFMFEINTIYNIKVTQSLDENTSTSPYSTFLMSTENVRPGFTLLQHVPQTPLSPFLMQVSQHINGLRYLSGDLFIQSRLIRDQILARNMFNDDLVMRRQGPSRETSSLWRPDCEPEDHVYCIHCAFWPSEASEWRDRPRHFGWPTQNDKLSVVDFGFHLVAIGHSHSDTKEMEWRISFSIAERTLVWSFNYIQMQCYALMKIILKQFIKVRCNPENQVLCSYFIKTFLFWKYETTDVNFWREDNLRECINYLLAEFSKCIREGMLRHYFIPRFNLLSVKLTPAAQCELLQLFDIIIESDISILKDCESLQKVWSVFVRTIAVGNEAIEYVIYVGNKISYLRNDTVMMIYFGWLNNYIHRSAYPCARSVNNVFSKILTLCCKTPLQDLLLKSMLLQINICSATNTLSSSNNKCFHQLQRPDRLEMCSFDISTCKLWCAIFLYMTGDYQSTLVIINQILSSIPPYALHCHTSTEAEQLYGDVFESSDLTVIQRAKKAWMFRVSFIKDASYSLPLAIKIQLYFKCSGIDFSPFTCLYYLQFLCYHDLNQYENRDRALEQIVDLVKRIAERYRHVSYSDLNIAGHCLLLAGKKREARDMFYLSYNLVQHFLPILQNENSAQWYILNCF